MVCLQLWFGGDIAGIIAQAIAIDFYWKFEIA